MVSDKPGRRPQKKSPRKKEANSPIFNSETGAGFRGLMSDHWPNLARQLASFMRASREKIDDVYSSAAQVIHEHKEAFEDRLAERKANARAATRATRQQSAPARPTRPGARGAVKDGTAKSSAVYLASKKPNCSPAKPRS
jgi:hypothetical protein